MLKKPYKLFFGTLANRQRLEIINLLRKGPKNVTHLCKELKVNQTTVSHNLAVLKKCSFVFSEKNGKERIYSLNTKTIKPLMGIIDRHTEEFCKYLCGCKTKINGGK
ncbi:winged helix-turn-helix transcriptional regulator [Candidatus Woesearchaeota archaeon]|nr:winged helix-turn-helix transcriptional regulator [Candidatus Woesearchaeota archaeon]